ncbi:MAG: hypothetical protein ACTHMV_13505 [Chitinophagaceae bacterium]
MNPNVLYCLAPRASGKTSGGIGPRIVRLSEVMPRSQIGLVTDSFERIDKVLLPGLEAYWNEELGLIPDVDYVVHKKPPDHWPKPFFIPKKWDRVTSFSSGFILCEISLNVSGSGNGFNLQAVIGDEVKYWDEKKFNSEVKPAIRGGRKKFGHLPEFQSQWFFSDKFPSKGADITWVLRKKDTIDQQKVDIVYTLQMEIFRLQQESKDLSRDRRYEADKKIRHIESILLELRKDLVYYCDALPYENIEILGEKYYRDQKRDLPTYEYEVAIENKDPDRAIKPFYPDFSEDHFYNTREIYDPNLPLIIALDYQYSITPIGAAQYFPLDGSPYSTVNIVNSLHTLHPAGMIAALDAFCDRHKDHATKIVYYVYDQTAIGRNPYGTTFKDTVIDHLTLAGWVVIDIYMGDTPDHDIKYEKIKEMLTIKGDMAVRVSRQFNKNMIRSIQLAPAKIVQGKTKKDKASELETAKTPPEDATHYSDVFDQLLWAIIQLRIVPLSDDPGLDISIGGRKG